MKRNPDPKPTEAQQRATFERYRHARPNWPATFEEAQQDPLVSRVLLALSQHVDRPAYHKPPRRFVREACGTVIQHQRPKFTGIDFKSRCAGEREEPDD